MPVARTSLISMLRSLYSIPFPLTAYLILLLIPPIDSAGDDPKAEPSTSAGAVTQEETNEVHEKYTRNYKKRIERLKPALKVLANKVTFIDKPGDKDDKMVNVEFIEHASNHQEPEEVIEMQLAVNYNVMKDKLKQEDKDLLEAAERPNPRQTSLRLKKQFNSKFAAPTLWLFVEAYDYTERCLKAKAAIHPNYYKPLLKLLEEIPDIVKVREDLAKITAALVDLETIDVRIATIRLDDLPSVALPQFYGFIRPVEAKKWEMPSFCLGPNAPSLCGALRLIVFLLERVYMAGDKQLIYAVVDIPNHHKFLHIYDGELRAHLEIIYHDFTHKMQISGSYDKPHFSELANTGWALAIVTIASKIYEQDQDSVTGQKLGEINKAKHINEGLTQLDESLKSSLDEEKPGSLGALTKEVDRKIFQGVITNQHREWLGLRLPLGDDEQ